MTESDTENRPNAKHRSFVPTDFSLRNIPGFLLIYVLLSSACVAVGLVIEALTPFWQGFAFGIAVGMSLFFGLILILAKRGQP